MNYSEKLKDPRWQRKRLEILERDNWCCQRCFDSESTLAVHHFRYIPGTEPWDYPAELLITLCEECHTIEYQMMPEEIASLIEQIKEKGFFHDQVNEIAHGFNALRSNGPPYMSSVIEYFLSTADVFKLVEELYFNEMRRTREAKNGTNQNN
jgi:hypothetical protein